jgi:hypothetical protein
METLEVTSAHGNTMKLLVIALVSSLVTTPSSVTGQPRPDFTGRWVLAPDSAGNAASTPGGRGRGGPPPTIGSGWGTDLTLAQDSTQLRLEYAFFTRSDMQPPHRFVFALDGAETVTKLMLGRGIEELRSRATYTGNQLTIVTTQMIPDPAGGAAPVRSVVTRTLSLETPALLRIVTVRNGIAGAAATTTQTLYRKQQ